MSYAVAQRTREIGIRMALGARAEDIAKMILARALRLALAGVALGLAAALAAARWAASLLYGVGPADGITLTSTCVLLGITALASSYAPARRAMRVDPAVALRED